METNVVRWDREIVIGTLTVVTVLSVDSTGDGQPTSVCLAQLPKTSHGLTGPSGQTALSGITNVSIKIIQFL